MNYIKKSDTRHQYAYCFGCWKDCIKVCGFNCLKVCIENGNQEG